ncbi:MAG: hypothetical protein V4541_10180 [Bacteroidota bacterium]
MVANSYIFFGLLLIPLLVFLAWVIKQDRKRSYLGVLLLLFGVALAAYTIIKLDKKYTEPNNQVVPKASSFR